ncbi:calcium-binding protein [Selenomonas sp. KH1T6]|uniref:calcium-binding protein n=1 Tax=Selenomonas sp. KH1T6 TaxID=3158784 RepID=UPI0008A7D6E4|nr:Ca2+-binding protein, RTX toxin-related [Selenomonas ruminantium]
MALKNNNASMIYDASIVNGTSGDDLLEVNNKNSIVNTGTGRDSIFVHASNSTINVDSGEKYIHFDLDFGKKSSANAKIIGSNGDDKVSVFESTYVENMPVTWNMGKGNDTITGTFGGDVFQYEIGDGRDVIEYYDGNDIIYLKSGSVQDCHFEGNDVVLEIGDGKNADGSITLKNMKNREVRLKDEYGNVFSQYYGTDYSGVEVVRNFIQTVSESPLKGKAALDEAVKACSSYSSFDELVNSMVTDCWQAGPYTFLREYCGISDSEGEYYGGAITGWGAGGSARNFDELMPKKYGDRGNADTFTKRGLTVTVPNSKQLEYYCRGAVDDIYSWGMDDSLDLIEKTYGFSFEKNPQYLELDFDWLPDDDDEARTENGRITINKDHFDGGDEAGRLFARELTHVVQSAMGLDEKLPQYMLEGMTELTAGRKQYDYSDREVLEKIAKDPAKLREYLNSYNSTGSIKEVYAAGYIFWRYLAKQTADSYDASKTYSWKDSVSIDGTQGDDVLTASGSKVTLVGGQGMDTLTAYGEGDSLSGGAGSDYLFVGENAHKTVLNGGAGADYLIARGNRVTVIGGTGNDSIHLQGNREVLRYSGGDGKDGVRGYNSTDAIQILSADSFTSAASGSDVVLKVGKGSICLFDTETSAVNLTVKGNAKANVLKAGAVKAKLYGMSGNDTLVGSKSNDTLDGGTGNDSLVGGAGNDYLRGDAGTDTLVGGTGKDTFAYAAGEGKDIIKDYETGKDVIKLIKGTITGKKAKGKDVILSVGSGSMTLKNAVGKKITVVDANGNKSVLKPVVNSLPNHAKYTSKAAKQVNLGSAYAGTTFNAGLYADSIKNVDATKTTKKLSIYGNAKGNVLKAGRGNTKLYGLDGDDKMVGGKGRDWLEGGNGDDTLIGGAGNDTLRGGKGNDTLNGGPGNDIYLYADGDGFDTIISYTSNQTIKIMSGSVSSVEVGSIHSKYGTGDVQDVLLTVGDGALWLKDVGVNSSLNLINEYGEKETYKVADLQKKKL